MSGASDLALEVGRCSTNWSSITPASGIPPHQHRFDAVLIACRYSGRPAIAAVAVFRTTPWTEKQKTAPPMSAPLANARRQGARKCAVGGHAIDRCTNSILIRSASMPSTAAPSPTTWKYLEKISTGSTAMAPATTRGGYAAAAALARACAAPALRCATSVTPSRADHAVPPGAATGPALLLSD